VVRPLPRGGPGTVLHQRQPREHSTQNALWSTESVSPRIPAGSDGAHTSISPEPTTALH
jgi:hypothetical protein